MYLPSSSLISRSKINCLGRSGIICGTVFINFDSINFAVSRASEVVTLPCIKHSICSLLKNCGMNC